MTPFQEFRLWARRAPRGDRASALVAAGVVVGLLAYVSVPSGGTSSPQSTVAFGATPSSQPSEEVAPSGPGTSVAPIGTPTSTASSAAPPTEAIGGPQPAAPVGPVGGSTAVPTAGPGGNRSTPVHQPSAGATTASSGARTCPASNAPGITDKQIKVAVSVTAIAASAGGGLSNAGFGVASVEQQRAYYSAAISDLNARGGIACRQVVAKYYNADPTDQNQLISVCNDIAQEDDFAVLDSGAYAQSTAETCYAQHKIIYIGGYLLQEALREKFYPYLFEFNTYDRVYHDTVFGLAAKGYFDPKNGFKKLGIFYRTCFPDQIGKVTGWLHQVGVTDSQIDTFSFGCPQAFANPSDVQNAVLQFRRDGVTHISYVQGVADLAAFTQDADLQQIHSWKYLLPDDEMVTVTSSGASTKPQADQMVGAVAVANARDGEETTPGYQPTAGTKRCDAIFAKYGGIKPTYTQPYAGGNACDEVWMLEGMMTNASALRADAMAAGFQKTQSIDFAFPQGPNTLRATGETTAGQFWRYIGFVSSCGCWRVTDPTFQPSTYTP